MSHPRSSWITSFCLIGALASLPMAAIGQPVTTSLTVTGFPISIAPTGSDFSNGFVVSAGVDFEVDATSGPPSQTRTTTVALRCQLPCPSGGSKSLASLQWQRADLGTWTTLTTSDVVVEQRSVQRNGLNDPWGNTLFFRFLLDWTSDPPATTGAYQLVVTLTVTAP